MGLRPFLTHRSFLAPVILLVVAAVVAGLLTGTFSSVARRGLTATGLLDDGGAATLPSGAFSHPAAARTPVTGSTPGTAAPRTGGPASVSAPPAVLAPATPGPAPRSERVAAKVKGVQRQGANGSFSGSVIDGGTGRVLYRQNATRAYIPASTLKLLTSTAALSILGPQHQFATEVVSSRRGRLTLVGGGDPYLLSGSSSTDPDRASLSRLAQLTAAAVKKDRVTKVTLDYDVSLFSGPEWHPDWPVKYRDQVTPITALWVNEGRVRGAVGARVSDPAESAADAFADALRARGLKVTSTGQHRAEKGSVTVASVRSLPLDRIVERLLMVSDNDAAEVVARQAAIGAGKPGSFAAARGVIRARLKELGVWDSTGRIRDGSGLSRSNRIPAGVLTKVLRLDLSADHPELRAVVTGLPVAGVEGSLRGRFSEKTAIAGRGLVRAKTGTLSGVHALAGYSRNGDGTLLVYAFLVNDATDYFTSRQWLDRVLGALSTCGCR